MKNKTGFDIKCNTRFYLNILNSPPGIYIRKSFHFVRRMLLQKSENMRKAEETNLYKCTTEFSPPVQVNTHTRCVIKVIGGVFVLSRCFFDFSVDVGACVIGLSQIFSFFSLVNYRPN